MVPGTFYDAARMGGAKAPALGAVGRYPAACEQALIPGGLLQKIATSELTTLVLTQFAP